jgi:hypothetical protein
MELTSIAEFVDEVDPRRVFTAETELMDYLFLQCHHRKDAQLSVSVMKPGARGLAIYFNEREKKAEVGLAAPPPVGPMNY